jgi:AraC-like DNA-binding protein
MNPNYLNRIFKEEKGVTLYAAVKDIRLEYAKKLLVETDLSTSEICATCGYSGEANFQRDFKKEFDTSPMKYRKSERERLAEEKDKG